MTVYEKYKRKVEFPENYLQELTKYIIEFSNNRLDAGKKVSKDILIQEVSAEVKRKIKNEQTR